MDKISRMTSTGSSPFRILIQKKTFEIMSVPAMVFRLSGTGGLYPYAFGMVRLYFPPPLCLAVHCCILPLAVCCNARSS